MEALARILDLKIFAAAWGWIAQHVDIDPERAALLARA
jgi:hypothetical protein